MSPSAKRVPDDCHHVIPHLSVKDASAAIEFYKKAFGAKELGRMAGPDGKSIAHAELQISEGRLQLSDEFPGEGHKAPASLGGTTVKMHLYVEDVDAAFDRAVRAGAIVTMPVRDTFWGDRYGRLRDPFGHEWSLASHVEDLTLEELHERGKAAFAKIGDHPA